MRKLISTIIVFVVFLLRATAEEGFWLPMLLGKQVYNDMVRKGLKLTRDQLFHINKPSVKDGIIIFGGGCSGQLVSAEGLMFTNHHCGYDMIAAASTVDNNYLNDGFYAKTRADEIPSTLTVQFLLRVEDVTAEINDSLGNTTGMPRLQKLSSIVMAINKRLSEPAENIEARVSSLFRGNQYLVFVYQRFSDVRLVGTPPDNIGEFGGSEDNWEWPRHSGDFAMFRIYTDPDGKPAPYSSANIPLKSKWFFPVSLKGFKEGEFTMIWGYPAGTNRYETSYGVELATSINNPALVKLREVRMKYMMEEMKKDPAIELQLAPSYKSVANYWKFFEGETKQLLRYDVQGQKKKAEEKFMAWAKGKAEYEPIFAGWPKIYEGWRKYALQRMYVNEGILGSPLMYFIAHYLAPVEAALVRTGGEKNALKRSLEAAKESRARFIEKENIASDLNALAATTRLFYEDIHKDQHPIGFFGNLRSKYGSLTDDNTYKKYFTEIFKNTLVLDDKKWSDFISNPDANKLQTDPAFKFVDAFYTSNYMSKFLPFYNNFMAANSDYSRLYLKGIMAMDTVKAKMMYPDGTFTMRVSYGAVKSYKPKEGVMYDYVTTSKGLLAKYIAGDRNFDLSDKQVELLKKKDFGPYIDKTRNDLVIAFISSNDISGGTSGSPVLNGRGELIGIAFDGNYEALSHRISYDKDLARSINVDIRYVLWCIDKLGGAGHLLKEMRILK